MEYKKMNISGVEVQVDTKLLEEENIEWKINAGDRGTWISREEAFKNFFETFFKQSRIQRQYELIKFDCDEMLKKNNNDVYFISPTKKICFMEDISHRPKDINLLFKIETIDASDSSKTKKSGFSSILNNIKSKIRGKQLPAKKALVIKCNTLPFVDNFFRQHAYIGRKIPWKASDIQKK